MFAKIRIEWLIALILVLGVSAAGATQASARTGLAQQVFCPGSGEFPDEQPALEGLSHAEVFAGQEIVLSLYGGGFSQVEGVNVVFFAGFELPVIDCAVISPGEMQIRLFFPEDSPTGDGDLLINLSANGDEAELRWDFRVLPPEGFQDQEPPPDEEYPYYEETPYYEGSPYVPDDGTPWVQVLLCLVLTGILGGVLLGIFGIRRLLRGGGKTKQPASKPTPAPRPAETPSQPPSPKPTDIRFIQESDPGVQEIEPQGPQPGDLDIHIKLESDPGQQVIQIEESDDEQ